MTVLRNTYGGLITGGLGLPACCGMITMQFHVFSCTIEIIYPGGGGPYAPHPVSTVPGFYVPYNKELSKTTRLVIVTVKMKDGAELKKHYVVDRDRADVIVKVFDIINAIQARVSIGINRIKHTARKVIALFKPDDK